MKRYTNQDVEIDIVNFELCEAVLTNGQTVPITNFFAEGREVESYEEAVSFVCGAGDIWFACLVDEFEFVTTQ